MKVLWLADHRNVVATTSARENGQRNLWGQDLQVGSLLLLYPTLTGELIGSVMGRIDANLGGGVIKQRIVRPGEGKSSGYRSILFFRHEERTIFMYGFPKSERDNITADEMKAFKEAAKYVLALSDDQMTDLVKCGDFMEMKRA